MLKYAPQIVYMVLASLGIVLAVERHGTPKTGKNNAWSDLLSAAILAAVLLCGGFFSAVR